MAFSVFTTRKGTLVRRRIAGGRPILNRKPAKEPDGASTRHFYSIDPGLADFIMQRFKCDLASVPEALDHFMRTEAIGSGRMIDFNGAKAYRKR